TTGRASSLTSLTEQKHEMNEVDNLTLQLKRMMKERDELRVMLENYTDKDLKNRLNFDLKMMSMEDKNVMLDAEILPEEISEAFNNCNNLTEEYVSCSQLLSECTQLKETVRILREENRKLRGEQTSLQESCEELRRQVREAKKEMYEFCKKKQQSDAYVAQPATAATYASQPAAYAAQATTPMTGSSGAQPVVQTQLNSYGAQASMGLSGSYRAQSAAAATGSYGAAACGAQPSATLAAPYRTQLSASLAASYAAQQHPQAVDSFHGQPGSAYNGTGQQSAAYLSMSQGAVAKANSSLYPCPTIVPVRLVRLAPLLTTVLDSYHSRRLSLYGPPAAPCQDPDQQEQDTTPESFCGN
ncbi:hypothetical protein STEG23_028973, partial [Scotinomys teguina]